MTGKEKIEYTEEYAEKILTCGYSTKDKAVKPWYDAITQGQHSE